VDETPLATETSLELVERLAQLKAHAVEMDAADVVIAADTIVSLEGEPLGKPADKQHCIEMLTSLSKRRHEVVTGVCLRFANNVLSTTVTTSVKMGDIGYDDASEYWETGEPADKAGAYAIQGFGAVFVMRQLK